MARKTWRVFIEGPSVRGDFFIVDDQRNIWDGRQWRGFTFAPKMFTTFRDAFVEAGNLQRRRADYGRTKPAKVGA